MVIIMKNEAYDFAAVCKDEQLTPEIVKVLQLSKNGVKCSVQGMAIFGDRLFQLYHTGICNVYDLKSGAAAPVANFLLGSYSPCNHANCCNFSRIFYEGNTIPLLYVVDGNSGPEMKCSVENITEREGKYFSEKVQEINLDQGGFEECGHMPCWGWPSWLVDNEHGFLYVLGAKYRTNGSMNAFYTDNRYYITKFLLPAVNEKNVVLKAGDVIEQFTTEYNVNAMQGGTINKKYLVYSFGFGSEACPSAIRIWDLEQKCLAYSVDLSSITEELEDCSFYNEGLYVVTQKSNLYRLAIPPITN